MTKRGGIVIELLDLEKAHAFLMKAVRSRDTEKIKGEGHKHLSPGHPDYRRDGEVEPMEKACYNFFSRETEEGDVTFSPGCLVGTAFHLAGVSFEFMTLNGLEHADSYEFMKALQDSGLAVGATNLGGRFLSRCQTRQDSGRTWGEAIRLTLKDLKEEEANYSYQGTVSWGTDAEIAWIREQQV